jgi:hypothetical protein
MKSILHLLLIAAVTALSLLSAGCGTQQERAARVERRQEAIDRWHAGYLQRQSIRSAHEEARDDAAFNAM